MPTWILYAGAATIIVTVGLTWILWRMNAPSDDVKKRDRGAGDGGVSPVFVGSSSGRKADNDGTDSGDGGVGSDGGDGGGGD